MGTLWGGVGIGGARGGPGGTPKRCQGQAMGGQGWTRWQSLGASGSGGGTQGADQGLGLAGDMGPPGGGVGPWAKLVFEFFVF